MVEIWSRQLKVTWRAHAISWKVMPAWRISTFLPFTHTIYTLIIRRKCKQPIERKTLRKVSTTLPLPLRATHSPSLSHCYTHWEEICTQILPTPIQSVESVFGAWEALEDATDGECNMELIEGSGKLEKTQLGLTSW